MKPTPAQIRAAILQLCKAYAAACMTGDQLVVQSVQTAIEAVHLPRLIPDKPTLADILQEQ